MRSQYKMLFLGLGLFAFLPSLKAQDSAVLVKDSMYWFVQYSSLDQTGMNPVYFYASYWLAGDTILNGKDYHKISPIKGKVLGLIREESKKVYYLDLDHFFIKDTSEILCYDFGLNVGDTFRLTENVFGHQDTVLFRMYNTSFTVLLTGERRRIMEFKCIYNNNWGVGRDDGSLGFVPDTNSLYNKYWWIEGIGSRLHPFYFLPGNVGYFESGVSLHCVYLKKQKIYGGPGDCYYTHTSIENKLPPANSTYLYPNPAHDRLYIQGGSFSSAPISVSIYNIAGQRVLSYDKPLWPLDISTLPTGLYILQLQGSQGVVEEKFLKD